MGLADWPHGCCAMHDTTNSTTEPAVWILWTHKYGPINNSIILNKSERNIKGRAIILGDEHASYAKW